MTESGSEFIERLGDYLQKHLRVELRQAQLLTGGASAETWRLAVADPTATGAIGATGATADDWILRRAPQALTATGGSSGQGLPKAAEASVLRAVADADVPVPEVLAVLDEVAGLGDGYFMTAVAGETLAGRILKQDRYAEARTQLAYQCGRALAGIHSLAPADLPELPERPPERQLDELYALYAAFGSPQPAFEAAFVWLAEHLPKTSGDEVNSLVHGDFRNGNLIVSEQGLAAVLDWELCHLGHPCLDLGWICVNSWRFGNRHKKVGGFGDLEQLLAGYRFGGGAEFDAREVEVWELFGTLRWGIFCMAQASTWLTGASKSVEKAIIGRRVSETALDLALLLAKEA